MTIFYTYLIGWKKQNKFYYGVRTDERIKELQEIIICPHCSKIGKRGGMQRWHFDHCKSNKYSNKILKENQICFGEI